MTAFAVVRIRGSVGVSGEIEETLRRLRLTRVNHCVVVPDTPVFRGMIHKVKDYVTWGEVDRETLDTLLRKKGYVTASQRVTEEYVKEKTGLDWNAFLDAVLEGRIVLSQVGVKPFRLHPPSGGYERKGIKVPYALGGALGYRGAAINDLLRRMM